MSDDLSNDARALLSAGKNARLSDEARERMKRATLAAMAGAAAAAAVPAAAPSVVASVASSAAKGATLSVTTKLWIAAAAVAVTTGSAFVVTRMQKEDVPVPAPVAPPRLPPAPVAPPPAPSVVSAPAAPPVVPDPVVVPPAPKPRALPRPVVAPVAQPAVQVDERALAEETQLLRNAVARVREQRFEEALRFLRTADLLHPQGALMPERVLTQVQALCGLHRNAEAQAVSERHLAAHPDPALRARVLQACPVQ